MTVVSAEASTTEGSNEKPKSPTVARRMLLTELNQHVKASGRTNTDIAAELGLDDGTVGRWLDGSRQNLPPASVIAVLSVIGFDGSHPTTKKLASLALQAKRRSASQERRPWMEKYRFTSFVGLEEGATALTDWEPLFIPGLLQTEDYARAVIRATEVRIDDADLAERVEVRMKRQRVLYRENDPLQLLAILDEAALKRGPSDTRVMRGQLQHLISAAAMPNVDIRVIPFAAGLHIGGEPGPLVLMEFESMNPIGYSETPALALYVETADEIARYRTIIDQLSGQAVAGDDAVGMITTALRA